VQKRSGARKKDEQTRERTVVASFSLEQGANHQTIARIAR
jgi:hypothetical protein